MNYKIFPTINYRIKKKSSIIKKDYKIGYKIQKLKYKFLKEGLNKSVSTILIVMQNTHPCLLTLQISYKNFLLFHCNKLAYKKGYIINKDQLNYIQRKVNLFFTINKSISEYKIKLFTLLGVFMRKNFESNFFPYFLPHIKNIKELRYIILFQLPKKMLMGVPKNLKIFAIPFLEIYKNKRYGSIISSLPILMSIYLVKKKKNNLKKV
uniref:Pre-mRNA cleavage factor I n=1 Tax=Lotharella vacuolata TaxID=74820 RepID=A0A0H5BL27_9EUKA|nr:pre-mRNA cleavage factor I [Lotharella vacuolata]